MKERGSLIEKLRHEGNVVQRTQVTRSTETPVGVIMNEHLMEALRRLRKNSTDNNVDRRLVTNVLLQFLATPRADVKRFEMLSLLATILSWSDVEREKAGCKNHHKCQEGLVVDVLRPRLTQRAKQRTSRPQMKRR